MPRERSHGQDMSHAGRTPADSNEGKGWKPAEAGGSSPIEHRVWKLEGDNEPRPDNGLVGQKLVAIQVNALIDSGTMVSLITPRTLENIAGSTGQEIMARIRKCQGES